MSAAEVTVDELAAQWKSGDAAIVDVREPGEYVEAHIPGVQLIPMGSVIEQIDDLPRDRTVYVVCAVGGRSAQVADYLDAQGYDVRNVAGGTNAWVRAGHPVETGLPE
ncbi:rhodanese-like domain-containing protein [Jiangella alkaliphila]|uniref:Rhodanese-related sulfurtransferase n=1 Tax=Jiangella alkaliphila TaxID=419479 RepID=A0A1H2IM98_9ACTN|nr:rhodanese-like domain-containing protein [Jiangella alkaliphila]SDU45234.1 Rhodanese-related sulfurtransferase [Jiangella alkaliphila]